MQSWCRTWPPNGSSHILAKQKLFRKHKGACNSSLSRTGSLKSFTPATHWNLAKPVKIFPGIIARLHHESSYSDTPSIRVKWHRWKSRTKSERRYFSSDAPIRIGCQMAPSEKPKVTFSDNSLKVREACEELSWNHCASTHYRTAALLLQIWLGWKSGGRIPWNVTVRCDMFKTSCQMGKQLVIGDVENHSEDQWFRSMIPSYFCERPVKDSINLVRKSYLDHSSVMHCMQRRFGKEIFWSRTLRSWRI